MFKHAIGICHFIMPCVCMYIYINYFKRKEKLLFS